MATRLPRKNSVGRGATWAGVCQVALKLPGVERGTCYGTPALRVHKKFLARLKENGEDVAIWIDFDEPPRLRRQTSRSRGRTT